MALTRNHRFFQALTSNLSAGTCNPFRSVFSISSAARRFYTPSLTTWQLQHTSADSISSTSQDNSSVLDNDKKARSLRHTRGQYHLLNPKRPRWTEDENILLRNLVRNGCTSLDVHTEFPLRSICSLDSRIARIRAKEVEKGTMDKKPRLSIQKQAWTEEEDQWLTKRLQEYGLKDREEHEISWPVIANGRVDGKSLGRTATSCKRRWTIIDPSSERHFGYWSQEEKDRLASAIRSQLEEMGSISPEESIKESMTDSTGVRNKLGLTLNGDNLVLIDWDEIGRKVATRSGVQCRSHAFKNLESGLKGRWDEDEVERLTKGIAEYGEDWHKIASVVGTRSAFQSRQKYNTILAKAKQQANQKDK